MKAKSWRHLAIATWLATAGACGGLEADATTSAASATYLVGPLTTAPTDGALPPVVSPFPAATTTIYFGWGHASLPANEQLTFSLIAVDVGDRAEPNSVVATGTYTAAVAGRHSGPASFSLPRPWPVGSYRVTAVGNTIGQFAELAFQIQ